MTRLLARLGAWFREHPALALELFVLSNLAFLALDIYVAHSVNAFAHATEWIPFYFSLAGSVVLAATLVSRRRRPRLAAAAAYAVGWAAVAVGVGGLLLHLDSQFFQLRSLQSLVYTAPFAAPLAYAGLGLALILNQHERPGSVTWSRWVVVLAWGGFAGNFALSLCDHAQNGFFSTSEWIPVVASAAAIGVLGVALYDHSRGFFVLTLGVLALQVVIGVVGFVLHVVASTHAPGANALERVVHGAPVFAPLLFPNLAILAFLGLLALQQTAADPGTPPASSCAPSEAA